MYEGLLVGSVASMLSLGTNLAATALTAYKAWFVSSFLVPCTTDALPSCSLPLSLLLQDPSKVYPEARRERVA